MSFLAAQLLNILRDAEELEADEYHGPRYAATISFYRESARSIATHLISGRY